MRAAVVVTNNSLPTSSTYLCILQVLEFGKGNFHDFLFVFPTFLLIQNILEHDCTQYSFLKSAKSQTDLLNFYPIYHTWLSCTLKVASAHFRVSPQPRISSYAFIVYYRNSNDDLSRFPPKFRFSCKQSQVSISC